MRKLLVLALVLGLVGVAAAYDLGTQAPEKSPVSYPENIPNPVRQGGDTIANALLIAGSLPYTDAGTTAGYTDDYDEVCPYSGSLSPDVVYRYVPAVNQAVNVDLCASGYDTKVYVYDASLNLVACNDDFYFGAPCYVYSSKVENVAMTAGQTYYIIVDGYGSASGPYSMTVTAFVPCTIACPTDAFLEGEPALGPNYVDLYNGGCNTTPSYPFQHISGALPGSTIPVGTSIFCGVSGWYLNNGAATRDTDWFTLFVGPGGSIGVTADAEYACYIFELAGTCAGGVTVAQQAVAGPCLPATMTIPGAPNATKWFWVGPTVFAAPGADTSFDYVVWFTGLSPEVISTEPTTWGTLKALYE